ANRAAGPGRGRQRSRDPATGGTEFRAAGTRVLVGSAPAVDHSSGRSTGDATQPHAPRRPQEATMSATVRGAPRPGRPRWLVPALGAALLAGSGAAGGGLGAAAQAITHSAGAGATPDGGPTAARAAPGAGPGATAPVVRREAAASSGRTTLPAPL